ncbi:hypothetical protein GCM10023321_01980 [Pseudonocardia eucalypti]|uniref:HTTM domain-containing protein n=1 Tax=Pseudonocardia eucalypti TaxID=648755 RepID=A0ABP9PH95_9PSEU|nr:hypothetical protein [Pseudonocardia eucalypti]
MKISAREVLGAATPAARLGLVRAIIGGYTLYYLNKRRNMFRRVNRTDPALFKPVGPCRVLTKPIPPNIADRLNDATMVSTALFTLGSGHRVVGKAHAALLLWTLSYRNSWSMIFHSDNTLVLHTLVLGAARSADAVSLDSLAGRARPEPHPRYGWPLQLMNAASTLTYLLAGIAKVVGPSGWGWAKGDGLRRQVAMDGIRKEVYGSRAEPTAYKLYPYRGLFTAFAVGSLALELLAPLGLLNRRLGRIWAVNTFGMHWGIKVIMGIRFRYQLSGISFVPWFDLDRLPQLLLFWRR